MDIIRGIYNLSTHFKQCVITLGNFDGIHLGHQALILHLSQVGKAKNLPIVVMIFEPQPLEFLRPSEAPSRLTSFREKCTFIQALGVDYILAVPFNHSFANMSAQAFIEQGLIKQLHAQYIVIGNDFRFGAKRQGDSQLLQQYADQHFFGLKCMPAYRLKGQRVSSTAVRHALLADDFELANTLLGRHYTIQGRVVHGNQLARRLGFPTANIHLNRKKPALHGVYFVKANNHCTNSQHYGIANIGIRPTVEGKIAILEVNIFDFDQDIYGHCLEVQFIEKMRDEIKFDSLSALQAQIVRDINNAQQIKVRYLK